MKEALLNFGLVVLIEAVGAIVRYLKKRLAYGLNDRDDSPWENHPDFV